MNKDYCDEHKERINVSGANCNNIREIEKLIEDKIFPAIYERLSIKVFLSVIALAVIFLGGSFGLLYDLNSSTKEKVEIVGKELSCQIQALDTSHKVLSSRFVDSIKVAPPPHHHAQDGRVIKE